MSANENILFIFDLDDTLYQFDKFSSTFNYVNDTLFRNINGDKIIFSNASYSHCLLYIKKMNIINNIKCIISSDIQGGGRKPNPMVYANLINLCNVKKYKKIFFFDDNIENLYIGKLFGWIPIWINRYYDKLLINYNYLKYIIPRNFLVDKKYIEDLKSKKSWLNYKFKNIDESLIIIMNINNN